MIQSRVQVTVRYAETDMMGIVYHGSYLPWFEIGRTTLLKEIGLPYRELEATGFRLPVVTTLKEKPVLRINLAYEVWRGAELLATGETMHAFIDREGKPVRPPPEAVQRFTAAFR